MKNEKKQVMQAHIAALERRLFEARAQYAATLGAAFDAIQKAENLMGSGVILQLTALGGKDIIPPVMIRDGLSREATKALQSDLSRSFQLATLVNPLLVEGMPR